YRPHAFLWASANGGMQPTAARSRSSPHARCGDGRTAITGRRSLGYTSEMERPAVPHAVTGADLAPLVERALHAVAREYPSHVAHLMLADHDALPPRELTPAFFGSFDWHSAVHGHWCLARGVRCGVDGALATRAQAALDASLTDERIAGELAYL